MKKAYNNEYKEEELGPMKALYLAVIETAIVDAQLKPSSMKRKKYRKEVGQLKKEAISFLKSKYCKDIASFIDVNYDWLIRSLNTVKILKGE